MGALCPEFRQASHSQALNNSSDLIVSESIRGRQHLTVESGEASCTAPHPPCTTGKESKVCPSEGLGFL